MKLQKKGIAVMMFALQFGVLLFAALLVSAKKLTVYPGQDVTLRCDAPANISIAAVKWTRKDLGNQHVLLYRGSLVKEGQHPSFKDRVTLQKGRLEDGEVSLILQNVKENVNGTYECAVEQKNPSKWYLAICIFEVDVGSGEPPVSYVGLIVGLILGVLVLVAATIGFICCRKLRTRNTL